MTRVRRLMTRDLLWRTNVRRLRTNVRRYMMSKFTTEDEVLTIDDDVLAIEYTRELRLMTRARRKRTRD